MGIFDRFKRKDSGEPASDGPSPDYVFAHLAMRGLALSEPMQFLAMAASPQAGKFIETILDDIAKQCGRAATFPASSVKFHPCRVKDYPCAVIQLPEPKELVEAHMVALVVLVDLSDGKLPDPDTVKGRYFTLEKGMSLSQQPRTVMAEWTEEGHLNYGDGPPPDLKSFVAALAEFV